MPVGLQTIQLFCYFACDFHPFENSCKDKKMTNIALLLPLFFLFFSCKLPADNTEEKTTPPALTPKKFIPELDNTLHEISGLLVYNKLFWGFNDSGGKDKIYGFNQEGVIEKEIELKEAKNRDWEAMAQDDENIYVGDFGNNHGTRDKLSIYKFKKEEISNKKEQKIATKKIQFTYANQQNVAGWSGRSAFDCEAMIAYNEHLYLFSKDWINHTTVLYKIPRKKGEYKLEPLDTFRVNGLITDAAVSPDKIELALLGYVNYRSFIWLFSDFKKDDFFGGQQKYLELENSHNMQSEGICYYFNDTLLVSCERTSHFKQQVFLIDLAEIRHGAHQNK